jgi:mono/diheme cytochrome c family protein
MPMSYSPQTGLVYIPAMHVPLAYGDDVNYQRRPGRWNTGVTFLEPPPGSVPGDTPDARRRALASMNRGMLVAWDPVKQRPAWQLEQPWPWNGGILSTAGNLLFQGDPYGFFRAYRADNGQKLWEFQSQRGIMAGPVTYRVKGVQYVAVIGGYGGSMGMATQSDFMRRPPPNGVMLAFRLDGNAKLAPLPAQEPPPYVKSNETFSAAQVAEGQKWYFAYCSICHTGPVNPNLMRSSAATDAATWRAVVIDGILADNGMISFKPYLTPEQAETVRAYVLSEAKRLAASAPGGPPAGGAAAKAAAPPNKGPKAGQ